MFSQQCSSNEKNINKIKTQSDVKINNGDMHDKRQKWKMNATPFGRENSRMSLNHLILLTSLLSCPQTREIQSRVKLMMRKDEIRIRTMHYTWEVTEFSFVLKVIFVCGHLTNSMF